MWPTEYQEKLKIRIKNIFTSSTVKNFCYVNPSFLEGNDKEGVFNTTYFSDINSIVTNEWLQLELENSYELPCVYIVTAHGSDISNLIWSLRARAHPSSIYCLWHFDNHVAYLENYKSAIAVDFNFISHNTGVPGYLTNPISSIVEHVPACCVQFGLDEIKENITKNPYYTRSSKALFNYIIYDSAPRTSIIMQLKENIRDIADFKLMHSSDRTRYWSMDKKERILEWTSYKCSVIVPLVQDLSTRVFDALATGQIPIIPEEILDLDTIITNEIQAALGIVRIKNLSAASVRAGISEAIEIFDQQGLEGTVNRAEYILSNGTTGHRISSILASLTKIATNQKELIFGQGANGCGIYVNSKST
jgi:hypothetical protein